MERLSKSERVGLGVFICAVLVFLLSVFVLNNNTTDEENRDDEMSEQMKEFKKEVELAKSDTISDVKTKNGKKDNHVADIINPLEEKLERDN